MVDRFALSKDAEDLSFRVAIMTYPSDTLEKLDIPSDSGGWLRRLTSDERHSSRRMHRHRELEMNLAVAGRAAYLLRDRRTGEVRRHPLSRGTLLFLYPEQDHLLIDSNEAFELWIAVFTPDLVRPVTARLPQGGLLVADFPPPKAGARLEERETRCLEALLAEIEAEESLRDAGLAYALAKCWSLVQRSEVEPVGTPVHPAVARVARLLHDETTPLSVIELGRRVGLSASRLSRLFHAQTGETIAAFRNRRRLERFAESANDAGATLTARALAAGFGSYAQFHRVHRAATGDSPSGLRAKPDQNSQLSPIG